MPTPRTVPLTVVPNRPPLWRAIALHLARLALVLAILGLIRVHHQRRQALAALQAGQQVALADVQVFFPNAAKLGDWDPAMGGREVQDTAGKALGYFIQTAPQSDHITGYSGPTNTLIAFSPDDQILGLTILHSGDTQDHVADVKRDEAFLTAFNGLTWQQAANHHQIDAVTGSTLTSLAIAQGVSRRLGGDPPNTKFPDAITLDEVRDLMPEAVTLEPDKGNDDRGRLAIRDQTGARIGWAARTSPAADDVMGYQGPTDTLLVFDADDKLAGLAIRHSFDNQPYVRYVDEDWGFPALFTGKTAAQLAESTLQDLQVEGVSGATMTSLAVGQGVLKSLRQQQQAQQEARQPPAPAIRFSLADAGLVVILLIAGAFSFTSLRKRKSLRIAFQIVLIGFVGFYTGAMLSQALMAGWARSGAPWRLAPGLVLVGLVALIVPMLSRKQMYCHQVCPFGAAQELLKNRLPWRVTLPRQILAVLVVIPSLLLTLAVFAALLDLPVNLASIEPFDAFLFWIAGWPSLTIAVLGLLAALVIPMAYCRFGCPTGAMLSFLRFSGQSANLSRADGLAMAILLAVLAVVLAGCSEQNDHRIDPPTDPAGNGQGMLTIVDQETPISSVRSPEPRRAMGTTWDIHAHYRPQHQFSTRVKEAAAIIEAVEAAASHWRDDSELSRINRHASTTPIPISDTLARVIAEALRVSQRTAGAFDITVAPVVDLWGFGAREPRGQIPPDTAIAAALQHVGPGQITLQGSPEQGFTLTKKSPEVRLDLSGIAKGYAIDQVCEHLKPIQLPVLLVELGGEVRVMHVADWDSRVKIESPTPPQHHDWPELKRIVHLRDHAIATSGVGRLAFPDPDDPTRHYSHIIDPRTGRPIEHNTVQVSVIAESAMTADALATALLVMGQRDGFAFARRHNIAATFVTASTSSLTESQTPAWIPYTISP